jgi:hypothetical protein
LSCRSLGGQPVGRRLRQRPPAARLHAPADHRTRPQRRATLRHLANPASVQRLRLQDPVSLLRDRIDPAEGDRRQQAACGDQRCGGEDRAVQARVSLDLRVGDPRSTARRGRVQPGYDSKCKYWNVLPASHRAHVSFCSRQVILGSTSSEACSSTAVPSRTPRASGSWSSLIAARDRATSRESCKCPTAV